jgi:hypothetical protein
MEPTNGKLAYHDGSCMTEEQTSQAFSSIQLSREFGPKIYGVPPIKEITNESEEGEEE